MLKTLIVAAAASAGAYNHTVLIPLMSSWPDDPSLAHRLRVIITAEAATLVAVILVTALLMGLHHEGSVPAARTRPPVARHRSRHWPHRACRSVRNR